jgi:hypothetical protein
MRPPGLAGHSAAQPPPLPFVCSAVEIPGRFGSFSFFESDFWKGTKPTPETIYRVHLVADEREFRVQAAALSDGKGTMEFEDTPIMFRERPNYFRKSE